MRISSKHKTEFFKNGWTSVDLELEEKDINTFLKGLLKLKTKANKIKYPFRICYYPHLTSSNIAGIECPFNKLIINEEIKSFFRQIELGKAIRELMDWEDTYLTLARLFTMENYNYRSQWHRDSDEWDGDISSMNDLQVAIYLKQQDGFRIFKLEREIWSNDIKSLKKTPGTDFLPLKISDEYFSEIIGSPGSVVFFAPNIIHQGNSNYQRLDFHFRFSKKPPYPNQTKYFDNLLISEKENTYFDFKIPNIYSEEYNVDNDLITDRYFKPKFSSRLFNSFNYYTAVMNIMRYLKNINKPIPDPWKVDLFANTIFQDTYTKVK